jgi:hypothetical protein
MTDMMCCPLSGGCDHGDGPTIYTTATPVARKEHRCTECREAIQIGTKYERTEGLWSGAWSTFKTCLSCVEIRDHFSCDGWVYGSLWEDLEQNFFPDMRAGGPCMDGLSPAAKARLFDRCTAWRLS